MRLQGPSRPASIPQLRPGPIASHPEHSVPPDAGPVTAQVAAYAQKVMKLT